MMSPSQETRARLIAFAEYDDDAVPLTETALLLAQADRPGADPQPYLRHLDSLVDDVRTYAEAGSEPVKRAAEQVEALVQVICRHHGYFGTEDVFDDIESANLMRGIDRRSGLPVVLSIVYRHVADGLGWHLDAIDFPGRVLLRLEAESERIIFDPFDGGAILDVPTLRGLLKTFAGQEAERTPLAIVLSSLDNLEHEQLSDGAKDYTRRAKDGAERLRRILNAMSEANRVEELMQNAELVRFDLNEVLQATVGAYRDAWPERVFEYRGEAAEIAGAPELLIQMLDKLVDNAVSFSAAGDRIELELERRDDTLSIAVENPGPPLPKRFRSRLFDSLVSVRAGGDDRHLGLGLYVARLIAEGHNGRIDAENTASGVRFAVTLPPGAADDAPAR